MTYLIIIFSISVLGIILMISYRSYELAFNKNLISDSFRQKSDQKLLTFVIKNIILLNRLYHLVIGALSKIPQFIGHNLHAWWRIISRKVDFFFERVKGKRKINNKGAASLYWRSIREVKDNKN